MYYFSSNSSTIRAPRPCCWWMTTSSSRFTAVCACRRWLLVRFRRALPAHGALLLVTYDGCSRHRKRAACGGAAGVPAAAAASDRGRCAHGRAAAQVRARGPLSSGESPTMLCAFDCWLTGSAWCACAGGTVLPVPRRLVPQERRALLGQQNRCVL